MNVTLFGKLAAVLVAAALLTTTAVAVGNGRPELTGQAKKEARDIATKERLAAAGTTVEGVIDAALGILGDGFEIVEAKFKCRFERTETSFEATECHFGVEAISTDGMLRVELKFDEAGNLIVDDNFFVAEGCSAADAIAAARAEVPETALLCKVGQEVETDDAGNTVNIWEVKFSEILEEVLVEFKVEIDAATCQVRVEEEEEEEEEVL